MRAPALLPLLILAGCGETGGGGTQRNEAAAAAPPAALQAGQWELTSEVTSFEKADQGNPQIAAPVGTRATEAVCVGEGERAPSALFTGTGYECEFGSYYASSGHLSVTARCRHEGLAGMIVFSIDGHFAAGTLEYNRNVRTILSGDGDVVINARVTGRRTGACVPPAPAAGASGRKGG